nr:MULTISPECIES: YceI family protein [Streptomyces]
MAFRSTSASHEGDGSFRMIGDLTIRDTTRPVHLQLDYLGSVLDPFEVARDEFRRWVGEYGACPARPPHPPDHENAQPLATWPDQP